jgi:hypothetical protein
MFRTAVRLKSWKMRPGVVAFLQPSRRERGAFTGATQRRLVRAPHRERQDDILMLVEYFVHRYAMRAGKTIRSIDKKTLDLLQVFDHTSQLVSQRIVGGPAGAVRQVFRFNKTDP